MSKECFSPANQKSSEDVMLRALNSTFQDANLPAPTISELESSLLL